MKLMEAIDSYISLKKSLGAVFSSDTRILKSFGRTLGNVPVQAITTEESCAFCRGTGPRTLWWERKHGTLQGFFAFLVSRGHLDKSPLPKAGPKITRSFEPYIYSREELQRILNATTILDNKRSLLRPITVRILLLVLYAAGLRPGEGLRLRCCDVEVDNRLLSIWDTKFFKSRLVPIGADLGKVLESYWTARQQMPMPAGSRSAFFAYSTGKAICLKRLQSVFARLRTHAGVKRPPESRWQPRLHDFRHAFAVHRIIAWYREGADVQACLPLLATYMGHINISGTQVYLTMTPELLAEASKRFACYAAIGKEEDKHDC